MPTIVTAEAIAARDDLADWRYLLGRLETTYRCGTFGAAGALAAAIAEAADAAGHHPDLDLRYPDVVHVALTTHAAAPRRPTSTSPSPARSRSRRRRRRRRRTHGAQGYEIAIDAVDIDAVRPFWAAVLGYRTVQHRPDGPINLVDPLRIGPAVWFQQMDAPRPSATASTSTSPSPTTSPRSGSPLRSPPEAASSATSTPGRGGCSPTPRATRPASAPGRTARPDAYSPSTSFIARIATKAITNVRIAITTPTAT